MDQMASGLTDLLAFVRIHGMAQHATSLSRMAAVLSTTCVFNAAAAIVIVRQHDMMLVEGAHAPQYVHVMHGVND